MMAAIMSSLTSVFNSASTIFTIDIWTRYICRPWSGYAALSFFIFYFSLFFVDALDLYNHNFPSLLMSKGPSHTLCLLCSASIDLFDLSLKIDWKNNLWIRSWDRTYLFAEIWRLRPYSRPFRQPLKGCSFPTE